MEDGCVIPQINSIQKVNEAYDKVIEAEGAEKQVWKVVEELGELQTALAKHARGDVPLQRVLEEVADTEKTLDKLKYMVDKEEEVAELVAQEQKELEEYADRLEVE